MPSLLERMDGRIEVATSGCWEWQGARTKAGYGQIHCDGKAMYVHRIVAALVFKQELKRKDVILHLCDNPCCCNPVHLRIGTQRENIYDAVAKGRLDFVHLEQRPRGAAHPAYKGSNWSRRIVRRCKGVVSSYFLADIFSVGQTTIRRWAKE